MQQELSKEELLDKIEETAHNYERDYHGCSRCVLRALQEHLNLGDGSAFRAATPLGGGIAMMGDTCGALLGALCAIGLATASENIEDEEAQNYAMANGYWFFRRFVRAMGSSRCRDIQTIKLGRFFNITLEEEYKRAQEAGIYRECPKVVGQTSRLAAEFILEIREREKATKAKEKPR